MIKRFLTCVLLFCSAFHANSNSRGILLDEVLGHLKRTTFTKAIELVKNTNDFSNDPFKQELTTLIDYSSQLGILDIDAEIVPYVKLETNDPLLRVLTSFNRGLFLFYYTRENDQEAMAEFVEALNIAEQHSFLALQNEILKAILEYHARYFSIYNDIYEKSLEKLKNNVLDDIDYQIARYYSFFFKRRRLNQSFESNEIYKAYEEMLSAEIPNFYKGNIAKHLAIHKEFIQDYISADTMYSRAITYYPKGNYGKYKEKLLAVNISYAVLKYKSKKYNESIGLLSKIYPKGLKGKLINWNLAYLTYWKSKSLYELKMVDSAYANISRSFLLQMEFSQEKHIQEVADLQIKYRTAEKEKQILLEQQRAITNRNWLILACVALFLGGGIAVLLQKNTSKKRQLAEKEALLKQQRVDNLLKEQELVSIDAMIAGQEKERQKVANELHDDLGSLMATVKLHFNTIPVDKKDPSLRNAQKLLDEAYQKIRGMAHAKNSGVMAKEGLLPAVKKMARIITESNALAVTVEDYGLADRMENSLELTIFRILQELVANIIKHANATKASIQFTQHEDRLNIIVEDNGKGFDIAAVKRYQYGMGLGSIEKRIEHLEGVFTVDSVLGKGTSILIDIPV